MFPKQNAEPGQFRSERTPWIRGPCKALRSPMTDFVDVACGSQMGKTDGIICNSMGFIADEDPRPQLYVGPTRKNVESFSRDRFDSMIRSTADLERVHDKGQKDKIVEKYINGVRIGFAWAGSATELASHPVYIIYIDERDRMSPIIGEGSVDGLAEARTATFNGVILRASTPLEGNIEIGDQSGGINFWQVADDEDVSSPIWRHWQSGSRHHFAIPCRECGEYFVPNSTLLIFDDEKPPEYVFHNTILACPICGSENYDLSKESQNTRGVYVAPGQQIEPTDWTKKPSHAVIDGQDVEYGEYLEVPEHLQHVSFWISGLLSPWRSYGHRARAQVLAKNSGDPADEQVSVNTGFGECYHQRGEVPDWVQLKEKTKGYNRGSIPAGVIALVCGVDVQQDRLYWAVDGFGANFECYSVDWGEILGETKEDFVWQELDVLLDSTYDKLPIHLMFIDSGYNPSDGPANESIVYQFCFEHSRAFPTKGHDWRNRPFSANQINVSIEGKVIQDGVRLWHLDSDYFKSLYYRRLEWDTSITGACYFPDDVDDEYLRQITAESRIVKSNSRAEWRRIRKDNHWGDCRMQTYAAAHVIGAHRFKDGMQPARTAESEDVTPRTPRGRKRVLSRGINDNRGGRR